ncbi:hypothetical protein PVAG01_05705 [Phlyctema vagabunda]|uniref:Asl1-like glycosyl hydrolase catalytic domain-containing protein n=1 Tax=Phlyctema vagabunda TaxID=108571 RepID=A0ABR4PKW4_9HELO
MRSSISGVVAFALMPIAMVSAQATFASSAKRGLVFVPNPSHPADNQIWVESGSDLTWYYNYGIDPSPAYSNRSQADFEFVPMLWGTPSSDTDTTFSDGVEALISGGTNISHILAFNEPDGESSTGGSSIQPEAAAKTWIREVVPLQKMGVQCGGPAVTGSQRGITWLEDFFSACSSLGTNCTVDFLPVHWYGNFEGLASFLGQVAAAYPNTSIWITEYALNHADLDDSQAFFNSSAEYFDRLDFVGRYSYFGSFRSSVSNVGPNAAMLTQKGELTDIGSWYLGGAATNNIPKASAAGKVTVGAMWGALVVVAVSFCFL